MKKIDKFWNWFLDNEQAILLAIRLGIKTGEVLSQLNRQLDAISKRIVFHIAAANEDQEKGIIIFSAEGYTKLFPKIRALEQQAPELSYFTIQAFIKPMLDKTDIIEGTDSAYEFAGYDIRISELYLSLDHFDLRSKKIRITLYVPEYGYLREYNDLESNLELIMMEIIGEMAFRKHIRAFQIAGLPDSKKGLLKLIELQDCIDHLYQMDARRKTRSL